MVQHSDKHLDIEAPVGDVMCTAARDVQLRGGARGHVAPVGIRDRPGSHAVQNAVDDSYLNEVFAANAEPLQHTLRRHRQANVRAWIP